MNHEPKKLKICFTSDVHGYFYPTTYGDFTEKPMGLFACVGDLQKDEETLVIDGGDILQGSAFAYYCKQEEDSPKVMADIMNDCGYDYYTLGNHDFNYGLEYQERYRKANRGRCLCENVRDSEGKPLYPYDIRVMKNGLRVGICGIVTDYINIWEKKENLQGISITDPFAAAKEALAQMRENVDFTICIYHGGFECDVETGKVLSTTTENVGSKIARELDFDILLTGHQHMSVDGRSLHNTYVVQPQENAKEYHLLEVSVADGQKEIHSKRCAADPKRGSTLRAKYQGMQDKVQDWLNQPLGHLSEALLPADKVEMALHGTKIADFLNRVQLYFSKAELSSVGLANEIAGFRKEVSTRDIIATYPYPNTLVVCEITGKQLKQAMERSAEYFSCKEDGTVAVSERFLVPKIEHYNYDYYSGVDYQIDPSKPFGSRIVGLKRNSKPVRDEDIFTLCMNNYRYSGAGGYEVYRQCPLVKEINIEMVELIIEFFRLNAVVEV